MTREKFQKVVFLPTIVAIIGIRWWIAATTGLGDDEAYYWDWTRELALNYYDHPPMTAWLIYLSTSVFGDSSFAIRLPSLLSSSIAIYLIYRISERLFSQQVAQLATWLFCLIPIFSLGSLLIVPDVPLLTIWLTMVFLLLRYPLGGQLETHHWVILGVLGGLGLLTKLTMVLLPFSVLCYFLFHQSQEFKKPGPWISSLVMILFFLPVLIWNSDNDWVGFKFHLSERHAGGGMNLQRFSQFIGTQLAFMTPLLYLICWPVLFRALTKSNRHQFLFWMSAPTLVFFSFQPLFSDFKPHWTAPGLLTLIPLLALFFAERDRALMRNGIFYLTLVFLLPINALFFTQTKFPVAHVIHGWTNPNSEWKPNWDPTNDLYGWPEVGKKLKALSRDRKGSSIFMAHRYQLAGNLSLHVGQPAWSYSKGRDQYDFFKARPPLQADNFFFVADNRYFRDPQSDFRFESCEKSPILKIQRFGILAREFHIWTCIGYQGEK